MSTSEQEQRQSLIGANLGRGQPKILVSILIPMLIAHSTKAVSLFGLPRNEMQLLHSRPKASKGQ